jgi:hypothetical protein
VDEKEENSEVTSIVKEEEIEGPKEEDSWPALQEESSNDGWAPTC